ncbi:MAG TPA: protocatechuate 3,4-dioxygenase subunit alpha [Burkholderiales bacterium]|nr:protocatechuate 3,4-dioxygenase subunit alpha [Burkholderiales bacterium]
MAELLITPSQTIGPFFKYGLEWPGGDALFADSVPGRRIRIGGIVTDYKGQPVSDALIEFWQADAAGRIGAHEGEASGGFGRVPTDAAGRYAINTIYPGAVPGADGKMQAPHILVVMFARGLLAQVVSRIYFEGEASNEGDPVLALCGPRATTLIAKRDAAAGDGYAWNVRLQGPDETVFFDVG